MGLTSVDEDTDDVLVEIVLALLWEKLLGVPRPDENDVKKALEFPRRDENDVFPVTTDFVSGRDLPISQAI